MITQLKPETEARIAAPAVRLGFTGPDAPNRVLQLALDGLKSTIKLPNPELTQVEIDAEYQALSAAGRKWRNQHPERYDPSNPPSKAGQGELYDDNGLPT